MEIVIEPLRSYEECVELIRGQSLEYSFMTSQPVKFNIHYHSEKDIMYPVLMDKVPDWSGTFSINELKDYSGEQEHFCMMWENPNPEEVKLTCEYRVIGE
ncbi:MAG: hypothetical protein HY758_01395 [Nitrospirae bacterium]|nr:hypothetical protein [Nitrospirota bacterium]